MPLSSPIEAGPRRLVADVVIQLIARIGNLLLGVIVTLILVRALGAHGFGSWSAVFAVGQIVAGVGALGITEIAVGRAAREPDREHDWLGALFSLNLLLSIPIAVCCILVVLLIAPNAEVQLAGAIISCAMLLGAPNALGAVFQLRVRNGITMAILTFNSVIWGGAVAIVALTSGGIVAFAIVFLATSAVTAGVTAAVALKIGGRVRLRGVQRLWRPLLRVGVPAGIAGAMVTLYVKLDQILVLDIAGSRQAGLYGAASRLLEQVQFIPSAVMTTLFPLIAATYAGRSTRLQTMLQLSADYLAMAALPILGFTIVAAKPVVALLFGHEFTGAAAALPMLAGAFVAISFGYLAGNMVVVLELQKRSMVFAAVGLVLNAGLNILLIPSYGFVAAAWITLLTECAVLTLSMRMVLRAVAIRPRFARIFRTLLAATIMGLATWLARLATMPLGVLAVVACVTYLLALILLRVVTPSELRRVLARDADAFAD